MRHIQSDCMCAHGRFRAGEPPKTRHACVAFPKPLSCALPPAMGTPLAGCPSDEDAAELRVGAAGVLSTHSTMVTQGTAGLQSGANAPSRSVPASSSGPGRPPPFRWAGSRLQWPPANACRHEPAPLAALRSSAEEGEPQSRPSEGTSGVFSRRQPEEPAAEAPLVRVRLVVNYRVHSRQMLCIGGSQIPFGWSFLSIAKVPMVWTEGDLWVTEVRYWLAEQPVDLQAHLAPKSLSCAHRCSYQPTLR